MRDESKQQQQQASSSAPHSPSAVKQSAGELLSTVAQLGGGPVCVLLGELGGVKKLIQAVAPYRARDPVDEAEGEFVANLFMALDNALLKAPLANQPLFSQADGLELMIRMIRSAAAVSSILWPFF